MNTKFLNIKTKIEKTFLDLLEIKDLNQISVSLLCKKAKINRSTFYTHYTDLYDLMNQIEKEKIAEMADEVFKEDNTNYIEKTILMFEYVKSNQKFYQLYLNKFYTTSNMDDLIPEKYNRKIIELANEFHISRDDLKYHLAFFRSGLAEIVKIWLNEDCQKSSKEMADIIKKEYSLKY